MVVVETHEKFCVLSLVHRDALDAFRSCAGSDTEMSSYEGLKRTLLAAQSAAAKAHVVFDLARGDYERTVRILAE